MRFFYYLFGVAIIFSCFSCKEAQIYKTEFSLKELVSVDTIPFNEIIKVGGIYRTDSFLILRDVQNNANDFFYVYSIAGNKFLYSFCPRGNGANEFLMPTVIKNMPDNIFSIRDHATDIITTYNLTDSAAVVMDRYHFPPQDGRFCWEINYVKDNKYLLKRNNSRVSTRELWNLKKRKQLDILPNTFDLAEEMGRDYHIEFDDCWISVSDTCFAFAYYFIGRIEYGKIVGDSIKLNGFIGVDETPDFYLFKESSGFNNKYKYNVDNNIVYYEDLYVGSSNIFALYSGRPWGDTEIEHSSTIEIYGLDGQPIKQLDLNVPLASFVVNEKENDIYGINPERFEGCFLKFKY